jgi:hypothetical protein
MIDNFPNPSIITEAGKTAYMFSIYSQGFCGEEDISCPRLKDARLSAGKAGGHQVEKSRYDLDTEGFWLCD